MRKAMMIAAALGAAIGAGAVARGHKPGTAGKSLAMDDQPMDRLLPYDAYPDELQVAIWSDA